MSEKKEQFVPIRKPTQPSKPPTKKKPEVTQRCAGNNATTVEEIKEMPSLSPIPPTPAVQVVEQTYQEGEVWEPNEPTTILKNSWGRSQLIRHDLFMVVCWSTEHQTMVLDYVKCPEYPCAFIASQQEVHQYLQAVE